MMKFAHAEVIQRYRSWPAVSQTCALSRLPSTSIVLHNMTLSQSQLFLQLLHTYRMAQ